MFQTTVLEEIKTHTFVQNPHPEDNTIRCMNDEICVLDNLAKILTGVRNIY